MNLKTFVTSALVVAAVPFALRADIDRTVEKTFSVTPGELLKVETGGGNIVVSPVEGNEVHVIAHEHFRVDSEEKADDLAKNLQLDLEQTHEGVLARAKFDSSRGNSSGGSWWNWNHFRNPVQVSFEITVPANYRTDLHTSGGNIKVGDLAADVQAHTSGGNIDVGKVDAAVDVHTSGGRIAIEEAKRSVKADTSGGDIRVGRVGGDADLNTSGGNIQIEAVAGVVRAKTSGGNVSANFVAAPKADCELRTSGGNVHARVVANAAFRLDASTAGGSVHVSELPIQYEHGANGKSHIVGTVHGGGPVITLRTSGGNVDVAQGD